MRFPSLRILPFLLVACGGALAAPLGAQEPDQPGPHLAGWRDIQFVDAHYGRGTIQARVHYPATSAGQGAPADPASGPYPLVAFMHGFFGQPSDYDNLNNHLASWGFVVVSIGTQLGITGSMPPEALDTQALLQRAEDMSNDPATWLVGMVRNGDWAASGHSMGGGACFYLVGYEPRVRTIVPLEPYRGASIGGFAGSVGFNRTFTGSVHLIAGEVDTTVPWDSHVLEYWNNGLATGRNLFTRVTGMGHLGPVDFPPNNEPLAGAEQHRLHRRMLTATLRAEMLGLEDLYVEAFGEGAAGEPIEQIVDCARPALWALPSETTTTNLVTGLLGNPRDTRAFAWSLSTASIQTQYGTLGLDLSQGAVFGRGTAGGRGKAEVLLPVRAAWSGRTVYVQGLSTPGGALTRVAAIAIP